MTDSNVHIDQTSRAQSWLVPVGGMTFAVVVIGFLSFDDITTDNATRFPLEYSFLLGGAIWCLLVTVWMARTGHQALATISLLALGSAVWGQRAIGPGIVPSLQPEYVATLAGAGWFLALSLILLLLGMRGNRARSPVSDVDPPRAT